MVANGPAENADCLTACLVASNKGAVSDDSGLSAVKDSWSRTVISLFTSTVSLYISCSLGILDRGWVTICQNAFLIEKKRVNRSSDFPCFRSAERRRITAAFLRYCAFVSQSAATTTAVNFLFTIDSGFFWSFANFAIVAFSSILRTAILSRFSVTFASVNASFGLWGIGGIYDKALKADVCPYNEAHRLHTYNAYRTHLVNCKDQTFPGVVKLRCPYDYGHIFTSKERLEYHKPRCENHPLRKAERERLADVEFGEVPGSLEYQYCPYYPYHGVRISRTDQAETHFLFTQHLEHCPRRMSPFKKEATNPIEQFPLTPMKPDEHCNRLIEPGLDDDLAERIANERVIIYFRDRGFAVRRVLIPGKQLTEKWLYIDNTISYNTSQFPGLMHRMEKRDHANFLVAKLCPDTGDKSSAQAFYALYGGLEKHETNKMAIVYQNAGPSDSVFLLVSPTEPNGFGGHLTKGELGLFCMRHTELLGVPSTLEQAIRRAELLAHKQELSTEALLEKEKTIAALTAEVSSSRTDNLTRELDWKQELDREREENRTLKEELNNLRTNSIHTFEELKAKSLQEFDNLEKVHEAKVKYLSQVLENEKREKSVIALNEDRYKQIVETVNRTVNEVSAQLKACEAQKLELQKRYESLLVTCESSKKRAGPDRRDEEMCKNCGEYARNTVFWPCGHLYYCNICLEAMRIPLGTSLKQVRSADKVCPICREEIKKVGKAFPWRQG